MKTWKNKYSSYQTEDFLQDESFIDWVYLGKPTDNPWNSRLIENSQSQPHAEKAANIILKLRPSSMHADDLRIEKLKDRMDARISAMGVRDAFGKYDSGKAKGRKIYRLKHVAAACLTALVSAALVIAFSQHEEQPPESNNISEVRNTRYGQKLTVHLSDGSKVKLNSGTTIRYEKYFSDSVRAIYLDGEAFFEVAKDSLRPFLVYAANTVTRAIGTSFNINSTTDNQTKISLISGKVAVWNNKNDQESWYLTPGNMIAFRQDKLAEIKAFSYAEIAWKDDVLVFRNATKKDVFGKLEKWYGVSFELDENLNDFWNYTGEFSNQSLKNVLTSIGYSEAFTFKIQNKKVVIKPMENQ